MHRVCYLCNVIFAKFNIPVTVIPFAVVIGVKLKCEFLKFGLDESQGLLQRRVWYVFGILLHDFAVGPLIVFAGEANVAILCGEHAPMFLFHGCIDAVTFAISANVFVVRVPNLGVVD